MRVRSGATARSSRPSCSIRAAAARSSIATRRSTASQIQGVTSEFGSFSTFNAERGRLMSAIEVDRSRPVVLIGWDIADRLFGSGRSARKDHSDRRRALPGRRRERQARFVSRAVAGCVRGDSARANSSRSSASRRQINMTVKPRDVAHIAPAMDDATVALRVARRLKPRQPDNFGMFTSDTFLEPLPLGDQRHLRGARRRGRAVAGRRRHRHHEHHADGGLGAHARDRPAQGARRETVPTSWRRS